MTKNDKVRHHKRRVKVHQIYFFLIIFYFFIFLFIFYFFGNLEQIRQHPN